MNRLKKIQFTNLKYSLISQNIGLITDIGHLRFMHKNIAQSKRNSKSYYNLITKQVTEMPLPKVQKLNIMNFIWKNSNMKIIHSVLTKINK